MENKTFQNYEIPPIEYCKYINLTDDDIKALIEICLITLNVEDMRFWLDLLIHRNLSPNTPK